MQEEWQQSLLSWQHPEAVFEASTVARLNSDEETSRTMTQRRLKWQEAFQSLYYSLRCGACAAFYVLSSKVGRLTA